LIDALFTAYTFLYKCVCILYYDENWLSNGTFEPGLFFYFKRWRSRKRLFIFV